MVGFQDDFDSMGLDIEEESKQQDDEFESMGLDIEQDYTQQQNQEQNKPGLLETAGDIFTQAGRGALKYFTWPADVLKLSMIGESLSGLDELEELSQREGKPFDRDAYVRKVFEAAEFVPTQELAEKGFENLTGLSLQPKTGAGKAIKQASEVAVFTPGGLAKKALRGGLAAGTTQALKHAGVPEGAAELAGDVAGLSPAALQKTPRKLAPKVAEYEKVARKNALPFLQYMTKERLPFLKGKISANAEKNIQNNLQMSSEKAMDKILTGEIPFKKYQDKGGDLDLLAEKAYTRAERKAKAHNKPLATNEMVSNIDKEISRIENLAPSPTDAQRSAMQLLERERDIMKVSNPTPEQLIAQHKNYNADMKSIYKKPEFSGKEDQIRKTYEFLKGQLINTMERQGAKDVTDSFKLANKVYHQKALIDQSQNILGKAFVGDKYDAKALNRVLRSKEGNFLRRNIGDAAVKEIEDIAKFGQQAQERITKFVDLRDPTIANAVRSWGQLGWAVFMPHHLSTAALSFGRPVAKRIQGSLLTRPATREAYKVTLKHASEGAFNLLKKDFANLEKQVGKDFGSVDNFIDAMMDDLEIEGEE